jgi:N-acyl-D-amino-acid deacylase
MISNGPNEKEYELLIRGGHVYNGLGTPGQDVDVAVKEERIVHLGPGLEGRHARRVIDASGLVVAPGFIDPHSHTDVELLVNPRAESKIRQGVTTEIGGNCGFTFFPLSDESFAQRGRILREKYDLALDWRDIRGFFRRLEQGGTALNYATLLGHGTLREAIVGCEDRVSEDHEVEEMKSIVEDCIEAGALGLSTGLIYTPGVFAQQEEIIDLCRVVAHYGGVYSTHMRDEGDYLMEAVEETIKVAMEARVSLQISHLKLAYPRNWSKIHAVLSRISEVRTEGFNIMADRYPYTATSTFLSVFFPRWAREGKITEYLKNSKGTVLEKKLRESIKAQEEKIGSWDSIIITSVITQKNSHLPGKSILQASREAGKDPYDFISDLIIEEDDQVGMINFSLNEETFKRIILHPLVVIGSDGWALAPYGKLACGKPHPRSYGTFPRMLGRYVRDEKLMPLGRAIEKMTSLTAEKFGLAGRGRIMNGYYADLVVFNPDTVIDLSTWEEPHRYSRGIEYVIVNGEVVIDQGEHTGRLPGKVLRYLQRRVIL